MLDSDQRWAKPVPGSTFEFFDCPAYYLRTAGHHMPAEHLIDEHTHPAHPVQQFAFEVESGARNVDSLSPKALELVHLWFTEIRGRDARDREMRDATRDAEKGRRRG